MKIKTISRTSEDYVRKSKLDITKVQSDTLPLDFSQIFLGSSKQRPGVASI